MFAGPALAILAMHLDWNEIHFEIYRAKKWQLKANIIAQKGKKKQRKIGKM